MCIAAWAWHCHPTHRLLLLFNRDEYHSRPTQPAQWWAAGEEAKEILGGRDELGGGTWMGCTRDGKLAFLTNVREPSSLIGAKTRGQLPVRFLQGSLCPLEYATEIAKEADQYNGFNLILADVNSGTMVYISNRPGGDPVIQTVAPGLHVLSNAAINSPWPKAMRLGQSFKRYLTIHDDAEASLKQMVEELMMDTARPDRSMVPDTGDDPEWEYKLSSIFIDTAKEQAKTMARYGTRSMVALAAKLEGEVTFYERYLENSLWKENLIQFQMEKAQ
ncbi:Ser/Thr-rich protein T10 in DGCR region [Zea mays]|uniref:Ser/Thr-rich protein T10 in DGCR region n=1 Tax=Zea mays TaxID=4577 RepID=A0A1D6JCY0_MAIZE|nr:Ser/Thr-rich protein T10 in DGCR region [Zea mays]